MNLHETILREIDEYIKDEVYYQDSIMKTTGDDREKYRARQRMVALNNLSEWIKVRTAYHNSGNDQNECKRGIKMNNKLKRDFSQWLDIEIESQDLESMSGRSIALALTFIQNFIISQWDFEAYDNGMLFAEGAGLDTEFGNYFTKCDLGQSERMVATITT